jgi:CRISPR/Cas system-associated exonuclease Cas4 (RecB family)
MFVLEKADLQRMIDEIESVRREGNYPDNMKMWICPRCNIIYLSEPSYGCICNIEMSNYD